MEASGQNQCNSLWSGLPTNWTRSNFPLTFGRPYVLGEIGELLHDYGDVMTRPYRPPIGGAPHAIPTRAIIDKLVSPAKAFPLPTRMILNLARQLRILLGW